MACVYRHIRVDTNETFYVGIGKYLSRAFCKKQRNSHWNNIINKTEYIVEILEENLTWEEACEKEKNWILHFGRQDLKNGTLVNKTDGGEGIRGHSDELKNILREHRIGKKLPEGQKKKISESSKGRILSESHKKNLSQSLSGRSLSLEHKENISKNMKKKFEGDKNPNYGKTPSKETIEKLREKAKKRKKVECPKCLKVIDITAAKRYHFDNCNKVL